MKRLTILYIAIFSLSAYAEAADWKYLGKNKNIEHLYYYYDKDSLHYPDIYWERGWFGSIKKKINSDHVGIWVKWVNNYKGQEQKNLIIIYCSSREFKRVGGHIASEEEFLSGGGFGGAPHIRPDTIVEELYKIVCG